MVEQARNTSPPHTFPRRSVPAQLLLVDDNALVREGIRNIVAAYDDLHIIGEASNGLNAVDLVRTLKPDMVVMDVNMLGIDGIEATLRIRNAMPSTRVIGLTGLSSLTMEAAMRAAGVPRCPSKESAADALYQAILHCLDTPL
jgi:DNA-binding NarL/FixJ family response regulator